MVRIIKTEPDKSVVKEVICKNCGVTLEYTPKDKQVDYSTDYLGGRDHYSFICCPNCTDRVLI